MRPARLRVAADRPPRILISKPKLALCTAQRTHSSRGRLTRRAINRTSIALTLPQHRWPARIPYPVCPSLFLCITPPRQGHRPNFDRSDAPTASMACALPPPLPLPPALPPPSLPLSASLPSASTIVLSIPARGPTDARKDARKRHRAHDGARRRATGVWPVVGRCFTPTAPPVDCPGLPSPLHQFTSPRRGVRRCGSPRGFRHGRESASM